MANTASQTPQNSYNPRYFIWTIVFLVASGVLLVTYMFQVSLQESVEAQGVERQGTVLVKNK